MLLVKRELSKKTHSKSELDFPLLVTRASIITYDFTDKPARDNRFTFELFEYYKEKPVRKIIKRGRWQKGQQFGFDLVKDYFIREGIKYSLKTTIYIENNREIFDVIFIQI